MRALSFFLLLCAGSLLHAQVPSEPWLTLETEHFRVHYPAAYEAWTLHLAARMESIHRAVTEEVGFVPVETVDVLIMDPFSVSNGMAMPFLRYPRMVLLATPPESWSPIGHYRDWAELLFLHEDAHLVHLLRPGRGGMAKWVERLLPFGPVDRKCPRWVSEGYATYLEGKMTGVGRPNGDFRAAILRKWALEGRLPSYGQMNSDAESWMGMSMAYLMGSAYMEWLVQRTDEGAWKRLWARLTAKKDRSFDAAFEGVFGDDPVKLYDRFTAELIWKAKELEREMKPVLAEGELWQDTAWTTGEPALSPDGSKMAIVLRAKDEPSRLVLWATKPDPEAEKKWNEEIEKIRKNDPEDVPGLRSKPFPAKVLFRMPLSASREPMNPRWMPDGNSILFTSYEPDLDGFYSPDLFLWTPESGAVRRVTRGAHVKEADPFPDGKRAVAVQSRFGATGLAEVDLTSGVITSLREPSVEVVYSQPRVSPDGTRLVTVRHADGAWSLAAVDLNSTGESTIRIPAVALPSFPAWSRDGRGLFASIAAGGFIDIYRTDPDLTIMGLRITRTMGGAIAAEPTPDGKGLYFLSLERDGLDVRYVAIEPGAATMVNTTPDSSFAPAVRPVPPQGIEFKTQELDPSKPYGAGRQEFSFLFGGHWTSYTEAWEAGVRGGDVLGRWNYFIAGGAGMDGASEGGTFALGWRGWPVEVTAQVYHVEQKPSEQRGWNNSGIPSLDLLWDRHRQGAALTVARDWVFRRGGLGIQAGSLWEDAGHFKQEHGPDRRFAYLEAHGSRTCPLGTWETRASLSVRGEAGETEAFGGWEDWTRNRVAASLGIRKQETSLVIAYERRELTGVPLVYGGFIEAMTLGGMETTLLPAAAQFDAVLEPALMDASMSGDRYEGWRVDLTAGGLPLFYQRHRLWWDRAGESDWLDLVGLEWDLTSGPMALVRTPGIRLTLGGTYIFGAPLEGKTRFWIGLSWTP